MSWSPVLARCPLKCFWNIKVFDCFCLAIQREIPLHTEEPFKTQFRIEIKACSEEFLTQMPNKHSKSLEKWSPSLRFLMAGSLAKDVFDTKMHRHLISCHDHIWLTDSLRVCFEFCEHFVCFVHVFFFFTWLMRRFIVHVSLYVWWCFFLQILLGLVYLCMNVFQWRMLLVFWGWGEKRKFDRVSWETSLVLAVADWPYPLPHRAMRRTELNISGTSHNPPVYETDAFRLYDACIKVIVAMNQQ